MAVQRVARAAIWVAALVGCSERGLPAGGGSGTAGATGTAGTTGGVAGTVAPGAAGSVGAAGSDAGGQSGTAAPPGGVDWEPWPAVDAAPPNACQVSAFSETASQKETWEYDAATRILARRHAASTSSDAWVGYVRLDGQGRREIACSVRAPIYCQEWIRDPLGNTKTDGLLEMGDGPFDLSIVDPAKAPSAARGSQINRYTHTYDGDGRLESTRYVYPGRGANQFFARDDQQRCRDVRWEVIGDGSVGSAVLVVDHWEYVDGRVASRVVTNTNDPADVHAVISYSYDGDGTLAATVVDGYADIPQPYPVAKPVRDGLADYVVRTVALSDNSRWLELLEFRTDNTNARVMRNGVSTPVARRRWHFSPGCRSLALPRHTTQDCEFERPFFILPLGWDNPYTTPIPLSTPSPSLG